jgi:F0F1-type ATP synthase assembly protein I
MTKKSSEGKRPNKFIAFSSMGIQLGITIYLGAFFGKKLDAHFDLEKPFFTMGLILFGFSASMYSIIKQLNRLNEKDD